MNISDLKKELQNLGLSTTTPGLVGDERYEELKYRLEQAKGVLREQGIAHDGVQGGKDQGSKAATEKKDMGLGQLTIGEIRSRLTALGISTATPGQTGDERWNTLKQRLVEAICGASPREDEPKIEESRQPEAKRRAPPVS